MTIGELIDRLKQANPEVHVWFAFGYMTPTTVGSWRGIYDEAALGFSGGEYGDTSVTVAALLDELNKAIDGREFSGWKGGHYTYHRDTPLHVDNSGCCTHTEIEQVEVGEYQVLIHTAYIP